MPTCLWCDAPNPILNKKDGQTLALCDEPAQENACGEMLQSDYKTLDIEDFADVYDGQGPQNASSGLNGQYWKLWYFILPEIPLAAFLLVFFQSNWFMAQFELTGKEHVLFSVPAFSAAHLAQSGLYVVWPNQTGDILSGVLGFLTFVVGEAFLIYYLYAFDKKFAEGYDKHVHFKKYWICFIVWAVCSAILIGMIKV